jgi:hypothetical protein
MPVFHKAGMTLPVAILAWQTDRLVDTTGAAPWQRGGVKLVFIVKRTHGTPRECGRASPSLLDNLRGYSLVVCEERRQQSKLSFEDVGSGDEIPLALRHAHHDNDSFYGSSSVSQ